MSDEERAEQEFNRLKKRCEQHAIAMVEIANAAKRAAYLRCAEECDAKGKWAKETANRIENRDTDGWVTFSSMEEQFDLLASKFRRWAGEGKG